MNQRMLFWLLLPFIYCTERVVEVANLTIYKKRMDNSIRVSPLGEITTIEFDQQWGVFAVDLYQIQYQANESHSYFENDNYKAFEENEALLKPTSGCHSLQRHMVVDEDLKISLRLPFNQRVFYTDIVAIPYRNTALLVRNDYVIFEVEIMGFDSVQAIQETTQQQNFEHLLKGTNYDYLLSDDRVAYLVEDTIHRIIYAITEDGGVSFASNVYHMQKYSCRPLSSPEFFFQKEAFLTRDTIYAVHLSKYKQVIYVACGFHGVDVYDVKSGSAILIKTLNASTLGLNVVNIVDADCNFEETMLYILDFERGLLVVDIRDLNATILLEFYLPISKARYFDHKGDTFMIVAETQNQQDYCVEVFIDFKNNNYYFNRFYIDEMAIFDIKMFEQFAILIGYDAHKVVYHSVYEGFINEHLEAHTYFQEPGLIKVVEMSFQFLNHVHEYSLVGLSRSEFKMFKVHSHLPSIECQSFEPIPNSTYLYIINASNCPSKWLQEDYSVFSQCRIASALFYSAIDNQTTSDRVKKYAFLIYLLLFVVVWVLILAYVCHKKCGQKLSLLRFRSNKLQKQEAYDNFQEGPQNLSVRNDSGVEMPTQEGQI